MNYKKILAAIISVGMMTTNMAPTVSTAYAKSSSDNFLEQLSNMVSASDGEDYVGSLVLTIGSDTMNVDGETVKIDDDNSVPIIENDTTLLPIRGVAEAIGAEVDYYDATKTVSLTNDETEVNMKLGSREIEINGSFQLMSVEAKTVNDRTLIPLRAATEALGCDVSWDGDNQTILLTRPYQTKRVIVHSENADTTNASAIVVGDGMTIMSFDTEQKARDNVAINTAKGYVAEPDYICKSESLSWGTDKISASKYYNTYGSKQSDLVVAVLDSGLDSSRSCFSNKLVAGYDFYENDQNPNDANGHGTHVASTVADVTAGFNKVKIMPLRTADSEGSSSTILVYEALKYAADNGAKVVNMSFGGYHNNLTQKKGVEYAISKGVTVVASAGNNNADLTKNFVSPACIDGVVAVSALNSNNQKAYFSNYGNGYIDVAAPGVNIRGAAIGVGTTTMSGTSMAAPHIAGVLALIRSVNPGYSSEDAINAMRNSCTNLGNNAYYGPGIPNLANLIPVSSSVSVTTLDATQITTSNARVNGKVSYSGTRPNEVGIYLGTSSSSMRKVAKDTINHNKNPFDMWYDLNSEAGQTLSPNTTYYYQCYAIVNGTETKGETKSFTTNDNVSSSLSVTTGDADTISGTNATVRGTASYSGSRPSEVGLYFGTSPDSMSRVASDTINHSKNPFDIWYDLNSEAGQYLSPATTYYYRMYGMQNGIEISGETKSFTTSPSSQNTWVGVVRGTDGTLVINSQPQKGYDIGYIPEGASVTVYPDQQSGNWYWVSYNGISGYSYKDYIVDSATANNTRIGVVRGTDGTLVINSQPHKGYDIGYIPEGASVTVYPDQTSGNWYWVSYKGVSGYSYKDYIIIQ